MLIAPDPSQIGVQESFEQRLLDQAQRAAQHFKQDETVRKQVQDAVEADGVMGAADASRAQLRETLIEPDDALGLERILGLNDLLHMNYLSRGLRAGRSVCRIHINRPNGRPEGFGTGFLVTPTLLLTNQHVLPNETFAQRSFCEFGYELDEDFNPPNPQFFGLSPERFFYNDKDLDFALVAVQPLSRTGVALSDFGFLRLTEKSGKALAGEMVSLIQHPGGAHKHIAIRNNRILNRFDTFIHYGADTEPGSSGSPVFNDQWDVVALHHAGVPKRNSNGKLLKKDGRIWQAGDLESDIVWIANEGIRISSIFAHLKAKADWLDSDLRVLEELGNFSRSNLNETILARKGPSVLLKNELDTKRPGKAAVPQISYSELLEKIEDPDTTEEDIAPYFELAPDVSEGIDPVFSINRDLVLLDRPDIKENAFLLNSANWISKANRQVRYDQKKASPNVTTRIISEGDSWFQYPLILHDVVDYLMREDEFAVLSFGGAGDLIRDMVAKAEFLGALKTEQPEFFIISGGGNDLVSGRGLKRLLKSPDSSFQPHQLIDRIALANFKAQIMQDYTSLFSTALRDVPELKILCHGYSYPVPNEGRWLGRPMSELGITDRQLQSELLRIIFDEVNDAIEDVAESFPGSAHYLDIRNVVPATGWYDELHPTNHYFGEVAGVFKEKILELS